MLLRSGDGGDRTPLRAVFRAYARIPDMRRRIELSGHFEKATIPVTIREGI
jgi:hypothetical protein